jgi:hypothetical protein
MPLRGYADCLVTAMDQMQPALAASVGAVEDGSLAPLQRRSRPLARRLYHATHRAALASCHRKLVVPLLASVTTGLLLVSLNLTFIAMLVLAAGAAFYFARIFAVALRPSVAARLHGPPGPPFEPEVLPYEIHPLELRNGYEHVLRTHEQVRVLLRESERIRDSLQGLYRSCGELVDMAGRVAKIGNAIERYLNTCKPDELLQAAKRLEARASSALDDEARRTYLSAASARRRQLLTYSELQALYERIRARLEVVGASLENVHALVIKLRALDLEQVALSGDCVASQLDTLRDDLQIVETVMAQVIANEELPSIELLDAPKKRAPARRALRSLPPPPP